MSVVPRIEVKVRLSHISWLVELLISSSGGSGETENLYVPSSQALNQGAPWQQWSSTPIDEQLGLGAASTPSHGACTTSTVDTRSWPLSDTAPLATNYLGMKVTSPMIVSNIFIAQLSDEDLSLEKAYHNILDRKNHNNRVIISRTHECWTPFITKLWP